MDADVVPVEDLLDVGNEGHEDGVQSGREGGWGPVDAWVIIVFAVHAPLGTCRRDEACGVR